MHVRLYKYVAPVMVYKVNNSWFFANIALILNTSFCPDLNFFGTLKYIKIIQR